MLGKVHWYSTMYVLVSGFSNPRRSALGACTFAFLGLILTNTCLFCYPHVQALTSRRCWLHVRKLQSSGAGGLTGPWLEACSSPLSPLPCLPFTYPSAVSLEPTLCC